MSWELDEPETVTCPWCHHEHDAEQYAAEGCPEHDPWDDWDDEGCTDPDCDCHSDDGGTEGVIAYGRPVTTLQPAERYL